MRLLFDNGEVKRYSMQDKLEEAFQRVSELRESRRSTKR